jgi:tetratricopeptide (TPR) repeat protein
LGPDLKLKPVFPTSSFTNFLSNRNAFFCLFFLGLVGYANAIFHPFVHDDVVFIRLNPFIADLNLLHIFKQTAFGDPNFPIVNAYYRPLLEIFNRLQYVVFGFNPWGYHLINIVFHILNSFLLFITLKLLLMKAQFALENKKYEAMAFVLSLIFLIHPIQSEAVACIAGISNILCVFFGLVVLYCYLMTIQNQNRGEKFRYYSFSLFFLTLGLLSKEQIIVVPALIIWFECLFGIFKQDRFPRRILIVSGYILVVLAYFLLRRMLFGHPLNVIAGTTLELYMRLLSIPRMILTHLNLLIWPSGLHYYRCIDIALPKLLPWIIFFITIFAMIGSMIVLKPTYKKMAVFGLGWFIICLLPTLNFIPLVNEYSLLLLAEHFLYMPMVGFFIFLMCLVYNALEIFDKPQIAVKVRNVFAIVVMAWLVQTIYQNNFWRSEVALFERTLRFEPNFGRVHILLAKAYAYDHNESKSFEHYEKAQTIFEEYIRKIQDQDVKIIYERFLKEILMDKAHLYEARNDFASAAALYQKVLINYPKDDIIYFNLGITFIKLGQLEQGTYVFEEGLRVNPNNLMMMNSLALCYKESGRLQEAKRLMELIVSKDPQSESAQENLKNLLSEQKP